MTPQELKYSIICLALQGKLVKQTEADPPVDLKRIKSKKTEEYEFDVPDSWGLAHLESVTNGIPSKQHQILESEVRQTGKYPVISQSKEYSIGFSDNSDKVYHHTKPVIIFGDHTTEVKYVEFDFIVGADGVKIFDPIDEIVTANFLFYVFQFYSKDLSKAGGYSRHYKFIKNKPIPIPPLAEQKRIVAKIEELLPLIDRYEQAWSRLENFNKRFPVDMQKSILQMAIQGKLVEQRPEEGTGEELYQQIQAEKQRLIKAGKIKKEKPLPEIAEDEIPFDIPESWRWVRVGDVFNVGTGMTPLKTEVRFYQNGTIPWVTSSLTSRRYIDNAETNVTEYALENTSLMVYPAHTLVVAMYGQGKTRGQVSELLIDATINQACAALGNIVIDESLISYVYYCFLFNYEVLRKKAEGTSQPNLNLGKIKETLIPFPPLAEQKRIVAKLEEILPLCEKLK